MIDVTHPPKIHGTVRFGDDPATTGGGPTLPITANALVDANKRAAINMTPATIVFFTFRPPLPLNHQKIID
jgi:hypothetical protein